MARDITTTGLISWTQRCPGPLAKVFRAKPYSIRNVWEKRNREHRQEPSRPDRQKTLFMLPDAIAKGTLQSNHDNRVVIVHNGVMVILARALHPKDEPGHAWLVSGYEADR